MSKVSILQTGVGNVASLQACIRRLGMRPELVADGDAIRAAQPLILPGVGAFDAAIERMDQLGLAPLVRQRIAEQKPTLAICLGMHLLGEGSEEGNSTAGISVVDARAERFPRLVRVPQIGWNQVQAIRGCQLIRDGEAYFANSFRWRATDSLKQSLGQQGWSFAIADHGGEFVAAIERGPILACQFHPELSADWGANLLQRWLRYEVTSC